MTAKVVQMWKNLDIRRQLLWQLGGWLAQCDERLDVREAEPAVYALLHEHLSNHNTQGINVCLLAQHALWEQGEASAALTISGHMWVRIRPCEATSHSCKMHCQIWQGNAL